MEFERRIVCSWLPIVRSCCFCIPLRIGTLIVGYFGALESTVKAIFSSILLVKLFESSDQKSAGSLSVYIMSYMLVIVILIASGINKILSIVLVIGGHTKKHNLFKVYFTYGIALAVCNVAFTVLVFVLGSYVYGSINASLVVIQLISVFIAYCAYVQMSDEVIQKEYTQHSPTMTHSSGGSDEFYGLDDRSTLEIDTRNRL